MRLSLLVLLLAVVSLPTWADRPLEVEEVGVWEGVRVSEWTYRSGRLKVKGLLFEPAGEGPLPCVIFCHDGIQGISREHRLASLRLARHGYVVFSPSYRGEDGSEGEIEIARGEVDDVLNALPLLEALPHVDPQRIGLVGASHGALISVLAASRSDRFRAVVAAYGVMDIYRWWDYLVRTDRLGKDPITRRTYGGGPRDRPEAFRIRNAVSVAHRLRCPVLILHGGRDEVVPPEQARYLKAALDRAGVPNRLVIYPDCLHGFLVYAPFLEQGVDPAERRQTEQAWQVMLDFLEQYLL